MASSGPKQVGSAQLTDPAQQAALDFILSQDLGQLFDPAQQEAFFNAQVRDPANKNFQENVIPGINEQFIGQGAASSSGLNRAVTQAGSDLQGQLAGSLSQFQQQGQQNQMQMLLAALGKQTVQPLVQEGSNPLGDLMGLAGTAVGGFAGGAGASAGANLFKKTASAVG